MCDKQTPTRVPLIYSFSNRIAFLIKDISIQNQVFLEVVGLMYKVVQI